MTEITLLTETTHRIQYLTQRALYSLCTHAQLEGKSQIGNAISTLILTLVNFSTRSLGRSYLCVRFHRFSSVFTRTEMTRCQGDTTIITGGFPGKKYQFSFHRFISTNFRNVFCWKAVMKEKYNHS